jgi:hypothetical protein
MLREVVMLGFVARVLMVSRFRNGKEEVFGQDHLPGHPGTELLDLQQM